MMRTTIIWFSIFRSTQVEDAAHSTEKAGQSGSEWTRQGPLDHNFNPHIFYFWWTKNKDYIAIYMMKRLPYRSWLGLSLLVLQKLTQLKGRPPWSRSRRTPCFQASGLWGASLRKQIMTGKGSMECPCVFWRPNPGTQMQRKLPARYMELLMPWRRSTFGN